MNRQCLDIANLRSVLELVAGYALYDFGAIDWEAVARGLAGTSADAASWFEYSMAGSQATVEVRLANDDPDTGKVYMEWAAPPSIEVQVSTILDVAQHCKLGPVAGRPRFAAS